MINTRLYENTKIFTLVLLYWQTIQCDNVILNNIQYTYYYNMTETPMLYNILKVYIMCIQL